MSSQHPAPARPVTHEDVLGAEFYCQLLQDNNDLLCKSLILDKALYAQLLNRCHFTITMINQIKARGVFHRKVQKLVDILKEKIRLNPDTLRAFCVCLQSVGQGPLSTHFNISIKRALEKRISAAKSSLRKKPGVFLTNPYDDSFVRPKHNRYQLIYPPFRPANQVPGGRRLRYRQDIHPLPYSLHQCNCRRLCLDKELDRDSIPGPVDHPGETTQHSHTQDPFKAYNVLAFLMRRIETQAKQIEDIKQRLRWVEIDQSVFKKTIGETITGSEPTVQQYPELPYVSNFWRKTAFNKFNYYK